MMKPLKNEGLFYIIVNENSIFNNSCIFVDYTVRQKNDSFHFINYR